MSLRDIDTERAKRLALVESWEAERLGTASDDPELGAWIATKRRSRRFIVYLFFVPFVAFTNAAGLTYRWFTKPFFPTKIAPQPPSFPWLLVIALVVIAAALTVLLWKWFRLRGDYYRFFERGVTRWRRGRGDLWRLPYSSVVSMTYRVVREALYGGYVQTRAMVMLEAVPQSTPKRLKLKFVHAERLGGTFFNRTWEGEEPMDRARDAIAFVVAGRLKKEIQQGNMVPIGPGVGFDRSNLRVFPVVGKERTLPLSQLSSIQWNHPFISLKLRDSKNSIRLSTNEQNFWPAFALLNEMVPHLVFDSSDGAEE